MITNGIFCSDSLKELMSLSLGIYSLINLFHCLTFNILWVFPFHLHLTMIFRFFNKILVNKLKIFLHHFISGWKKNLIFTVF